MSQAARAVVAAHVNGVAQLKAVAWAVAQVKAACSWAVRSPLEAQPEGGPGWSLIRGMGEEGGEDAAWPVGMRSVRDALLEAGHPNMLP
jgi:hypothetical protein